MSPKRRTFLSLVFACICLSKSLLINNIIIIIIKVFISSQDKKYISHNIGKVNDRQGGGITQPFS